MHIDARPTPDDRARHPRPRLMRASWHDLGGDWEFASESDRGPRDGSVLTEPYADLDFTRSILVPFPPESALSGVHDTAPHDRVWYRRTITDADVAEAGGIADGHRLLLHFGAVDYRARIWVGGRFAGSHEGGHTPFSLDITDLLETGGPTTILVSAEDDASDLEQPRGKQDWEIEPHVIWYHRTSGIWQPVWLESVPTRRLDDVRIEPSIERASVTTTVELAGGPRAAAELAVVVRWEGMELGTVTTSVAAGATFVTVDCPIALLRNGQGIEPLLWSPENPVLVDVEVRVTDGNGADDTVHSYTGFRSIRVDREQLLLNERPIRVRAVLAQGYWPESHLAAPDADALRREVELIRALGFTTARVHEKVEDPRFLYWADRLGLMVWAEMPSAYAFSPRAIERTTAEWMAVVRRDRSHPCIVAWVPFNESWGVQHAAHDPAQTSFVEAMYRLTKAIDPSRPVISNDGWEHATSDLMTIHDYTVEPEAFANGYATAESINRTITGIGPAGRRIVLEQFLPRPPAPVIVSEFGGITYAPDAPESNVWGYATVSDARQFERLLRALVLPLRRNPLLAGFCYTQLSDTLQEANGLTTADRTPKLPIETLREIFAGGDR